MHKIAGEKFTKISGMGTFDIQNDNKCSPLLASNVIEFDDEKTVTMNIDGEICNKKYLSTFNGEFNIISGTGDFVDSTGTGDVSLLIGKKFFAGNLYGTITFPGE